MKESELQNALRNAEKRAGECESLPSRKKLLKRIKKIAMYLAGNLPDGEKDSFADNSACDHVTKKHGFCVIDQSQHPNALLAVMIQGLLFIKRAAKISTVKLYGNLVFGEINARLEDIRKVEESDPLIQVLEETKKGIKLYLIHQQKHARAAKNILRVMVSNIPRVVHSCTASSYTNSFFGSLGKIPFLLKFLQSRCSLQKRRSLRLFPLQPKLQPQNSRRKKPSLQPTMFLSVYCQPWMTLMELMHVCT